MYPEYSQGQHQMTEEQEEVADFIDEAYRVDGYIVGIVSKLHDYIANGGISDNTDLDDILYSYQLAIIQQAANEDANRSVPPYGS